MDLNWVKGCKAAQILSSRINLILIVTPIPNFQRGYDLGYNYCSKTAFFAQGLKTKNPEIPSVFRVLRKSDIC